MLDGTVSVFGTQSILVVGGGSSNIFNFGAPWVGQPNTGVTVTLANAGMSIVGVVALLGLFKTTQFPSANSPILDFRFADDSGLLAAIL
jgi:hypothetical protein